MALGMVDADAPTEEESDRNGVLSYAAEWHALSIGVYDGLKKVPKVPNNRDVEKEPHYYKGGYVIGRLLQVVLAAAGVALGIGVV